MSNETNSPEHQEIQPTPENTMRTVRIVVARPRMEGRHKVLQILTAINADKTTKTGHSEKSGQIEVPGGTVEAGHSELQTALDELEQETGLCLHPSQLIPVEGEAIIRPLEGTYPGNPNLKFHRTQVYVVALDQHANRQLKSNWAAHHQSTDDHDEINFIDAEQLIDPDWVEVAKNSQFSQEVRDRIAKALLLAESGRQADILRVIENPRSALFRGGKPDQKVSILDASALSDADDKTLRNAYKKEFGIKRFDQREVATAKELLLSYCVDYAISEMEFLGEFFGREEKLRDILNQKIEKVKTAEDLFRLWRDSFYSLQGRAMWRAFVGYRNIYNLDYFTLIDEGYEGFKTELEKGVYNSPNTTIGQSAKDLSGNKVNVQIASNPKQAQRMASKAVTKADIDPKKIRDVYRARIIVADETQMKNMQRLVEVKFGTAKPGRRAKGAWNLKLKEEGSNVNRDEERKEIKLIGTYPMGTIEDVSTQALIPVEIQIMTKDEYERSETGSNHHEVYMAMQKLVEISRPCIGIDKKSIELVIDRLSRNPEVLASVQSKQNPNPKAGQLQPLIRRRLAQYFFQAHDGKYYAYQHILRLRNTPNITAQAEEMFGAMCETLNEETNLFTHDYGGIPLTYRQWRELFDLQKGQSPSEEIREIIGVKFITFSETLLRKKWDLAGLKDWCQRGLEFHEMRLHEFNKPPIQGL